MIFLPSNAVLLLIDMQKGFDDPHWGRRNNPRMERRVIELLDAWRERERPVVHVKHMSTLPSSPLRPGQSGNELKAEMTPLTSEPVIEKRVNSSFIGTSLESHLRASGCDSLVIAGLTTNHCVSTTARMAGNLGFTTWVIADATATFDRKGPDGRLYSAEQIHAIALSDLHGEFAAVVDTRAMIDAVELAAMRTSRMHA